jgi:hypothetical protein
VRQLLAEVDSRELSEWMAFDRLEPLPDGYFQAAVIASTVANTMGGGRRKWKPKDFMPKTRTARRVQSAAEGLAIFNAMFPSSAPAATEPDKPRYHSIEEQAEQGQ